MIIQWNSDWHNLINNVLQFSGMGDAGKWTIKLIKSLTLNCAIMLGFIVRNTMT